MQLTSIAICMYANMTPSVTRQEQLDNVIDSVGGLPKAAGCGLWHAGTGSAAADLLLMLLLVRAASLLENRPERSVFVLCSV